MGISKNTHNSLDQHFVAIPDLALATTLSCLGFKILSLQPQTIDSKRLNFTFEQSSELESAVADYWSDTAQVSPKKYFFALRELKSRLWAMKEGA